MSDIVNVYEVATFIHEAIYEAECLLDDDDRLEAMTFWVLLQESVQKRYPALSVRQFNTAFAIADEQKRKAVEQGVPVMQVATMAQQQHKAH
jgi:hypothetical protein